MPYQKKYRGGYTAKKRNGLGNRKKSVITRAIREEMGLELKFFDTFLVDGGLATTGNAIQGEQNPTATVGLSTLSQGDGEQQRDGRRATWKSLYVTGYFEVEAQVDLSTADDSTALFLAIVLDTQANGAFAKSEDIYVNPSNNFHTCATPLRNLENSKRFRVLATRKCSIDMPNFAFDGTNMERGGAMKKFDIYINFGKGIVANYTGSTGDITNNQDYAINVISWASNTDFTARLTYTSRLRFYG